jgi:N-acetylmuramoyl-L-alanine amidase
MLAVGLVVKNRANHKLFPKDICKVINQPAQFSWVGSESGIHEKSQWRLSTLVATRILNGEKDITEGSTHFHSSALDLDWTSKRMRKTIVLGGHQFYRLVG